MRMFGYYAWHTLVNQIRKLFKTWVLILLLACVGIGGLIGFLMESLMDDTYTSYVFDGDGGRYDLLYNEDGIAYREVYEDPEGMYVVFSHLDEEEPTQFIGDPSAIYTELYDGEGNQITAFYDADGQPIDYTLDEEGSRIFQLFDDDGYLIVEICDSDLRIVDPATAGELTSAAEETEADRLDAGDSAWAQDGDETEAVTGAGFEDVLLDEEGLTYLDADGNAHTMGFEQMAEAIGCLVILLVLGFFAMNADKNGGKLFMMADVNLLFASPLKPQTILFFRLLTKLGSFLILMIIYGFIYIPTLVDSGLLTLAGEFEIFLAVFLLLGYGTLLQVFVYALSATYPKVGRWVRMGLFAFVGLLLMLYTVYWRASGMPAIPAAFALLSLPALRFVPVVGWMKAIVAAIFAHEDASALIWILVSLAGMVLLIAGIWRMKFDFYEDAMSKSEEVAKLQAQLQENGRLFGSTKNHKVNKGKLFAGEFLRLRKSKLYGAGRTKKGQAGQMEAGQNSGVDPFVEEAAEADSSDERLDGFSRGSGASMYFFKAMHVRYRFATLHYFTKTTFTYLGAAALAWLFGTFGLKTDLYQAGILIIGAMLFFRALGNPLEEDIQLDMFRMIPVRTSAKIFWSLLGGILNCLLDLLPAMLLLTVGFDKNPLLTLGWLGGVMTLYLYATCVGAFIDVSIPINAGTTIKQAVQVMFFYFGLLPDAGIIIAGMLNDQVLWAVLLAVAVNLLLAGLFLLLTARILAPKEGSLRAWPGYRGNHRQIRRHFSRIGWSLITLYLAGSLAQIAALLLAMGLDVSEKYSDLILYAATFLPLYLVGFPLGLLILRKLPKAQAPREQLENFTIPDMIKSFLIMVSLGYLCLYLGNFIISLLTNLFGVTPTNTISEYVTGDTTVLQILFLVILAPIMEEFLFRRMIIDRTRIFGEKWAILFSALLFGLFHGNLSQFLYATALGLVLGYVYLRSGKLRCSIGLHMAFNFLGSIIAGFVDARANAGLEALQMEDAGVFELLRKMPELLCTYSMAELGGILIYVGYLGILMLMILSGLILLGCNRSRIHFYPTEGQFAREKGTSAVLMWINPGMIAFVLLMVLMIVITLVGMTVTV